MARIIFVNLFGIGNCVLSTPAVSAIASMGHAVDVLVLRRKNSAIAFLGWDKVSAIHYDVVPRGDRTPYDAALWAHPLQPGFFHQDCPMTSVNPAPWSPMPYHWRFERHEVLEILELARSLGYAGGVPTLRPPHCEGIPIVPPRTVAIGIGYAKAYIWKEKHWGNVHFSNLCRELAAFGYNPVLFGDSDDQRDNGWEIEADAGVLSLCGLLPLPEIMANLRACVGFIGNDTGLMHAAASFGIPTLGIFRSTDPKKNRPWGNRCAYVPAACTPKAVVETFLRL